jgi:2-phospho-L-lactate/phosphoenolpyruvate guanylyltransferase
MTSWTAIVPMNVGRERKTRLASRLSGEERERLAEAMARHVVKQLLASGAVGQVCALSPHNPHLAGVRWLVDRGRGLNAELADVLPASRVLVIHADLPLLNTDEVHALVQAAERAGAAIAPDKGGSGTNAIALKSSAGFIPNFGHDSLARHRVSLPIAAIIERPGLALDVDTPDDLDAALAAGAAGIVAGI